MHNKHEIPLLHIYFSAFAAWTLINLNTEVAGGGGGGEGKISKLLYKHYYGLYESISNHFPKNSRV